MLAKVLKGAGEVHSGQVYMWYNQNYSISRTTKTISLSGKPFMVYMTSLTSAGTSSRSIDSWSQLFTPYNSHTIVGELHDITGTKSKLNVDFQNSSVQIWAQSSNTVQLLILYTIP